LGTKIIMKKLNKYKLDYDRAWEYTQETLDEANTLSSELLKAISFEDGDFFTLLPPDANRERLYEFKAGVILPNQQWIVAENSSSYSVIPTIRDELSELLLKAINSKRDLCYVIDDVNSSLKDENIDSLDVHGLFYREEIYYMLNTPNISKELLLDYLNTSNAFWHSLCVLTKTHFSSKELDIEKIHTICSNIQLIMVGAYDGEGYIFWEKKDANILQA